MDLPSEYDAGVIVSQLTPLGVATPEMSMIRRPTRLSTNSNTSPTNSHAYNYILPKVKVQSIGKDMSTQPTVEITLQMPCGYGICNDNTHSAHQGCCSPGGCRSIATSQH